MSESIFDPTDGKRIEHGPGLGGDYLAPATLDPALQPARRFPGPVTVTREQLGIRPPSPIRAYLERHRDQAAADREIAEIHLEDAQRDLAEVIDRQVTTEAALAELDFLETEQRRLARIIVGPERTSPTTTQETP